MDAFFASVEQRDNPELRGKPVVVGGNTRGVVAAASYEARQFGIRSAMPMRDALRRCPNLCRVPPRMSHYQAASKDVFSVFREFTPMVEGLSLDEAFLDVTESLQLFGDAVSIAREVKQRILDRTHLTASVGVAPNKLVAKIASDLDKPDGLVVVTEENLRATLDPLPVQVIPGIGKETLARLRQIPINTVADLRCAHDRDLEPVFGRFARRARDRATGIDDRPVMSSRADKSISAEETFDSDLDNRKEMHRHLLRLAERTAGRLRAKELVAGTVQVKIRQSDFTTYTRQRALKPPGNGTDTLYQAATSLLDDWLGEFPGSRIRLLGVGGSELSRDAQPDLFTPAATVGSNQLDQAVDQIRDKFGDLSLGRARTMDPDLIRQYLLIGSHELPASASSLCIRASLA
jgi:DNA polymerase-4